MVNILTATPALVSDDLNHLDFGFKTHRPGMHETVLSGTHRVINDGSGDHTKIILTFRRCLKQPHILHQSIVGLQSIMHNKPDLVDLNT
jgi:hypothetical protein